MIKGIGTDLIEIKRIKKAMTNEAFLIRYFTSKEIALINGNAVKAAGNFAVKEAVSKVFGTGFGKIAPSDIEVLREASGKPYINLFNEALKQCEIMGIAAIHVSISNTAEHALAYALGEGE